MFLVWAGVSLPDNALSFGFLVFPFLASSLAFLAASLAVLLFKDFSIISVATFLFSSKKYWSFSLTIASTTVLAWGVPNLPLVWPSNCNNASGTFKDTIAVNPSLTSLPSKALSFPFIYPLFLAYSLNTLVKAVLKPTSCEPPSTVLTLLTKDTIFSL